MAKRRTTTSQRKELALDFGTATPKQQQFLDAHTFFVCYGGARGGGKSHIARVKAVGLAMFNPGIQILMVRCHYPELEANLILPILKMVPQELYTYNQTSRRMKFENGSAIKFGHWDGPQAENEYQGVEYDVIFIDEATQLSERAFNYLTTCVRGVNEFPKRMYLTCNPGGVGHRWVKRLFIDRNFRTNSDNPAENENPEDYTFIPATVYDNPYLLKSSPKYLKQLSSLPESIRKAHRDGDWNALGGNYFKGFGDQNTIKPFRIPDHWPIYRAFDYGLDMLAVGWFAVDEDGRSWCFREYEQPNLKIQDAAAEIRGHTLPNEKIRITYAPPDMWNRLKNDTRTMAELFFEYQVPILKASNDRVQGHMIMANTMLPIPLKDPFVLKLFGDDPPESLPALMFFDTLERVISDIKDIQADEKNPNDCAKEPHEVTHSVDMVRYYCISRASSAEAPEKGRPIPEDDDEQSYEQFMCGSEASEEYLEF